MIYREFHSLGRLALGLGVLSAALLAGSSLVDSSISGWLIVSAIFVVFPVLSSGASTG